MPNPAAYLPVPEPNRILAQNLKFEEEFEKEKATGFADRLRDYLFEIGVPPRLQKANAEMLPAPIARLKCFAAMPEKGFGLVGDGGVGKSCALVYGIKRTLWREWTEAGPARIVESPPKHGAGFEGPHRVNPRQQTEFKWIGWPAFAARMKSMAARREWTHAEASTEALIQWITTKPQSRVLILDDIGEEGVKAGSYTSEQLELLIDNAWNYECRIFWTSNHSLEQMSEATYYGYRLVSRLTGLSPDATLPPGLPDLRIHQTE